MIVLYYEISQGRKIPEYYRRAKNPLLVSDAGPLRLGYRASRIWEWDSETDAVRCIKSRYNGIVEDTKVDPKEFLKIQLTAQEYKREIA